MICSNPSSRRQTEHDQTSCINRFRHSSFVHSFIKSTPAHLRGHHLLQVHGQQQVDHCVSQQHEQTVEQGDSVAPWNRGHRQRRPAHASCKETTNTNHDKLDEADRETIDGRVHVSSCWFKVCLWWFHVPPRKGVERLIRCCKVHHRALPPKEEVILPPP